MPKTKIDRESEAYKVATIVFGWTVGADHHGEYWQEGAGDWASDWDWKPTSYQVGVLSVLDSIGFIGASSE